jgi:hypothetical protein
MQNQTIESVRSRVLYTMIWTQLLRRGKRSCSTCGTCRDCCKRQSSAISWREQVRFDDRDDDTVRFVPDSTLSYIYTLTPTEQLSSLPVFGRVRIARSLVCCVMFCRSLFVPLSFFFWSLCCLSFGLRILITPLVSSNSSYI